MPIAIKKQVKPQSTVKYTMEHQHTNGPYDNLNVYANGVRVGQVILMHNVEAKGFIQLITRSGVQLVVDTHK